jgi:hypothetical protein
VHRRKRPLLANNVIALLKVPNHVCSLVKASISNLVLSGTACSRSDRVGDAGLDARGRPTRASRLVIDRASGLYAPSRDRTGRPRGQKPDIGAFEYAR